MWREQARPGHEITGVRSTMRQHDSETACDDVQDETRFVVPSCSWDLGESRPPREAKHMSHLCARRTPTGTLNEGVQTLLAPTLRHLIGVHCPHSLDTAGRCIMFSYIALHAARGGPARTTTPRGQRGVTAHISSCAAQRPPTLASAPASSPAPAGGPRRPRRWPS